MSKSLEYFKLSTSIAGIGLILVGILGFIPAITPNGKLIGLFMVNDLHNSAHILTGLIMLLAAYKPNRFTIFLIILIGIVFLLLVILGIALKGHLIFIHVNTADNILHIAISAFAFFQGWIISRVAE